MLRIRENARRSFNTKGTNIGCALMTIQALTQKEKKNSRIFLLESVFLLVDECSRHRIVNEEAHKKRKRKTSSYWKVQTNEYWNEWNENQKKKEAKTTTTTTSVFVYERKYDGRLVRSQVAHSFQTCISKSFHKRHSVVTGYLLLPFVFILSFQFLSFCSLLHFTELNVFVFLFHSHSHHHHPSIPSYSYPSCGACIHICVTANAIRKRS